MTKSANSEEQHLSEEATEVTENILTIDDYSMESGDINVTTPPPSSEQEKTDMTAVKDDTNTTDIGEGDPPPSPEQDVLVLTAAEGLITLNKASSYETNESQCHSQDEIEKEMRARDYNTVGRKCAQTINQNRSQSSQ
jgi:hypothetical protein